MYGEGALDVRTCQKWFAKFKVEEFNLSDQERPGRPVEANDTLLEELTLKKNYTLLYVLLHV